MEYYIELIIWGLCIFSVLFIFNYFIIYKLRYKRLKKKKLSKTELKDYIGFSYLIPRFKLDINKIKENRMFFSLSIINAFIVSITFMIIYIIPWNVGFKLMIGFVLLFALIYSLYEIYGRHLVKKGWEK